MSRKTYKPEQIVHLLRKIEVEVANGKGAALATRGLRKWLAGLGARTLYIEPGRPWENGYCESFKGNLRDECLKGEILHSLKEAQVVIEQYSSGINARSHHCYLTGTIDRQSPLPAREVIALMRQSGA